MTRLLYAFALLFVFASCTKEPLKSAPAPELSFNRTLSFPNRNGEIKLATYNKLPQMESIVSINDGKLRLFFNVPAATEGSTGEGIALDLSTAAIGKSLIRDYSFDSNGEKILYARYNFTNNVSTTSFWSNLVESLSPGQWSGNLRITGFDAVNRTISGSFTINATNLFYDPTIRNGNTPPDVANRCNLQLEGSFAHVKIR
ncbi:hypothetical protein SAMN05444008_112137 [Cnuella takakiae]|uniref:Uncharacterized protein n=1 Tax=Cnuella takakiae TaxID=1302690 RepID=A0A1M5EQB7_9BACT|nr:hypothetical protein [Cnuella takakiae]OLY91258.1 hypothetical protein BUE76_04585 [Cnuella takakiae]SHF81300.1 hypothetical protein SAMN05444008_112137 [Cnuella takakiae]